MNQDIFLKRLSDLTEIKTLSGDIEANSKALDLVTSWVNKKTIVKRHKFDKAEILILSNVDTLRPDYCYMVHMDVVSAPDVFFRMTKEEDILTGRGVCDMKFSIPMGIDLLNEIIEKDVKKTFSVVITTDEENGGFGGAKNLVEKIGYQPLVLIVPDGGDNVNFVSKAKGVCQLKLTMKGVPAHASRPWMGESAIEKMVKVLNKLLEKYGETSKKETWETTMNLGMINGGISTNQVCAEATLNLDFRYPESDSIENIKNFVTSVAMDIDPGCFVEQLSYGLPTSVDEKSPEVVRFLEAMESSMGMTIKISHTYGASDARWFASLGVPVMMIKPMGGEIHSDKEWISLSSCMKFYEGLYKYLVTTRS